MAMMFGDLEGAEPTRGEAIARLATGFGQGAILYGLVEWGKRLGDGTWMAALFSALALTAVLLPVVALGSINRLQPRPMLYWLGGAGITLLALGAYDGLVSTRVGEHGPSPLLGLCAGSGLFIGHALISAAQADRRWLADYHRYFDSAWKDGVRIALGLAFVGALWIVLGLGSALFGLIGLKVVGDIITKPWFAIPATTTFFAAAIHITDVRAGLVRGIRTVALTLLSWLAPVMGMLTLAFLAALPLTGLKPLWDTRSAAGILLGAAAALIVLLNAAYQEGEETGYPPLVISWTARVVGLLVLPLVVIAGYGVLLRVGQYGLTPERIIALACVLVGLCYGLGYAAAAVWPKGWMVPVERTNILTAHLVLAVILALFSPIADPRRLSVDDQMSRLAQGKVTAARFDYGFLRWDAGAYGRKALARLAAGKGESAGLAREAQEQESRYETSAPPAEDRARLLTAIGSTPAPADFLSQDWPAADDPFQTCRSTGDECRALVADLDGDSVNEVAIFNGAVGGGVYARLEGRWARVGVLQGAVCGLDDLKAGRVTLASPDRLWKDVLVGGRRLRLTPQEACPPGK